MDIDKLYTIELKRVLTFISKDLLDDYPAKKITTEHFILSLLNSKQCIAYKVLNRMLPQNNLDAIYDFYAKYLHENIQPLMPPNKGSDKPIGYDTDLSKHLTSANYEKDKLSDPKISTEHVLLSILNASDNIKKQFELAGVTYDQFSNEISQIRIDEIKKNEDERYLAESVSGFKSKTIKKNVIESYCVNLNRLAQQGKIDNLIGREAEINRIVKVLGRRTRNNVILVGENGVGKCMARGTKVLMFNCEFKNIEDIKIGDKLMGIDSNPRNVLSLGSGMDEMYEVIQKNGIKYTVNSEHILSLKSRCDNNIIDIPIKDYLSKPNKEKLKLSGFKCELLNFDEKSVLLDPYFIGLWLGDGTSDGTGITNIDEDIIRYIYEYSTENELYVTVDGITYKPSTKNLTKIETTNITNGDIEIFTSIKSFCEEKKITRGLVSDVLSKKQKQTHGYNIKIISDRNDNKILKGLKYYNLLNNKHIPIDYKVNTTENRLKLLAGIIDSDGYLYQHKKGYEITQKNETLFNDIVFICRSLGLSVRIQKNKVVNGKCYHRCSIFGELLKYLPVKLERKKTQNICSNRDNLRTGIKKIESIGIGEYFGFTIDGDNHFILEDFTVTHNTALILGIADKIEKKEAKFLNGKTIFSLNITSLIAGTTYRGDLEGRMNGIINELKFNKDYILFIDDIHTVLGKNSNNSSEIAGILSNALSDGDIQLISTTSFKEYKSAIESNTTLARRFQRIVIEPTNISETENILANTKSYYENYHHVKYTDNAIKACVFLADKYISDRKLPDSAIDILDECGSEQKLYDDKINELVELKDELKSCEMLRDKSMKINDFKLGDEYNKQAKDIKTKIIDFEKKIKLSNKNNVKEITETNVYSTVSEMTGIPLNKLSITEKEKYLNIEKILNEHVIGQENAINEVSKNLKRNRMGLDRKNKPRGVFLFSGSSGTGKTLLAKKIAEEIFGSEKSLIRFDMSEYSDKTSVNKLIGSGAGYVMSEQGGVLTETIKNNPYCVLLFDEIEKADKEVLNLFLQVFDDGSLSDNIGTKVSFKNVIIIMTSNIGARDAASIGGGVGFQTNVNENKKTIVEKATKAFFSPEFINRLDKIIQFNELTDENLRKIISVELNNLNDRLKEIDYLISFDDKCIDYLFGFISRDKTPGARKVGRIIQTEVEDKICDLYLEKDYEKGYTFSINIINNKLEVI